MNDKAKTVLIGCFIIIASLATIGVLLFLRPAVGDGKKQLLVCFTSIDKVQIGTRVTFAGKPVGEVTGIREIYDARNQPTGRYGHICFYELELAIDSSTIVYNTDEVTVHTSGLLGERTIAIIPRPVPKGKPSYPITDQVMYGKSGDPVEETLNQIIAIGNKASQTFDEINEILSSNKANIHKAIASIDSAATELATTFKSINEDNVVTTLNKAITSFHNAVESADNILQAWDKGGVGTSVPDFTHNLAQITNDLNEQRSIQRFTDSLANVGDSLKASWPKVDEILNHLQAFSKTLNPNGSIGQLFAKEEFYLQLTGVMNKMDILASDINQYGLLFHQDKAWKRTRMNELKVLDRLDCPQAFQGYFEGQIQQMWICLERVSQVLRRAQQQCCGDRVITLPCFNEEFSRLINQLDCIEETLKLYRERLIDRDRGCAPKACCQ